LNSGAECDDGNLCTVYDRCQGNTCVGGESRNCSDDDLTCTEDLCNSANGRCEETVTPDFCAIGRTCVKRSQINPDQICQVCNPDADPRAYGARSDSPPCDDGLTCTENDSCGSSGVCVGRPMATTGSRCPAGYCDEGGRCGGDLVAAGASHSCALRGGSIFCFGRNHYGQLGDQTTRDQHAPVRVGADSDWSQVVAGNAHTCGRRGGAIYCWGKDEDGQLGNGEEKETWFLTPQRVGTGEDWGALAAGGDHTCAIRQGALYCWGRNTEGQLGDGTTQNRHAPTRVGTDMDWIAVTAGLQHTCGLRGNDLYCWGDNAFRQLGDRTNQDRQQPVPIGLPGGWSGICAGDKHTCGFLSGSLYCWGSNAFSQLGLQGTNEAPEPAVVPGQQPWETIVCGGDHTCATRSGGDLYCWGRNNRGQLGDGKMADSAMPLAVIPTATGLSIGRYHACAVQNAVFRCWGENDYGQLGDGTTDQRPRPVAVMLPGP
jgi:alpha-tubulin suppressor-like RCC1 family protein